LIRILNLSVAQRIKSTVRRAGRPFASLWYYALNGGLRKSSVILLEDFLNKMPGGFAQTTFDRIKPSKKTSILSLLAGSFNSGHPVNHNDRAQLMRCAL
jgi:hypothetical protein